jgi:hypothetical protein
VNHSLGIGFEYPDKLTFQTVRPVVAYCPLAGLLSSFGQFITAFLLWPVRFICPTLVSYSALASFFELFPCPFCSSCSAVASFFKLF